MIRNIIVALAKSTALFLGTAVRPASPLTALCRAASHPLSSALLGGQQASLIQVGGTVKSIGINYCTKDCERDAYVKLLKSEYMSKDHLEFVQKMCF